MVVFDATVLTLLLWDGAKPPDDPSTGKPIARCKERMELLVQTLHEQGQIIMIPTPALSEVLVVAGSNGLRYINILQQSAVFRVQPFDTLAAIELATINRKAIEDGDKKSGEEAPWQQIKIDRQIIAISKVVGAQTVYSDDEKLGRFAAKAGLTVIRVHELPLPPEPENSRQTDFLKELEARVSAEVTEDESKLDEIEKEEVESDSEEQVDEERSPEPPIP